MPHRPAVRLLLELVRRRANARIPAGAPSADVLTDDMILHAAEDAGIPLGNGRLLEWIVNHPDEILNFVLLILRLIELFA